MHRALRRALCRVGLFSLVLGGGALALPSLAAANPACGKVVTHNVTLSANMNCTSGNDSQVAALFVGNNGITINLNGFSITGNPSVVYGVDNAGDWNGNAPGSGGTSGPGTGFNNDKVENGNVTGFGFGLDVENTTGMKISNMTVYNSTNGLALSGSNKASVTGSHFGITNNGNGCDGTVMDDNAAVTISDSTFNWNGCKGIDDFGSQATLNGVKANHNGQQGFFVDLPVAPYLVENSKANANGFNGFEADNNHFNTITFTGNNSENNDGWGYFAQVFAHGTNNGFENDASGGCHNVGGCHLNP
jgi:hypothetical protein